MFLASCVVSAAQCQIKRARTHVQAGWFRDDLTVGGGPFNEGETVVKASSRLSPGSQRANQLAQEERNFSC